MIDQLKLRYEEMLKLRVELGYAVGKNPQSVSEFIDFCIAKYPAEPSITKAMLDDWLLEKEFRTDATRNYTISKIRTFTNYLRSIDESAYVPSGDYSMKKQRFTPYIFTDEELQRLFSAIDTFPPSCRSPKREYIIPVLFRMMYCCGMRPQEPLTVLLDDIDFRSGELYIRQAKGYKDRRIVMSDDLRKLCAEYAVHMSPERYLFERVPGKMLDTEWVRNQFELCWKNSGLPKRGKPRPYDFRHNYAARTITRWVHDDKDVTALAPFLSAYMGHTSLEATWYYIHLVPERLRQNAGINWERLNSIYPEVSNES
jgi:integrase